MGKLKPRSTPNLLQRAMEFANRVGRVTIDSVAVELACARSSAKNVLSRLEKSEDLVRMGPGVYAHNPANGCEHGDHAAPPGKRFCSEACARCEIESESENGCDGICVSVPGEAE